MNELEIIEREGAITSSEMGEFIEKSLRAIIRQLNNLEARGEIKIIVFKSNINRRNLYISNELFSNLYEVKKS